MGNLRKLLMYLVINLVNRIPEACHTENKHMPVVGVDKEIVRLLIEASLFANGFDVLESLLLVRSWSRCAECQILDGGVIILQLVI